MVKSIDKKANIINQILNITRSSKIGTWNLRSLYTGKLNVIIGTMDKLNIELLGLSEVRWQGNGYFKTDTKLVIYSGQDDTRKNGVALVLSKKWSNSVSEYKTISDRVICVRVMAVPMNLTVIQVYAPKSELSDDELEVFYAPVQLAVDKAPKSDIVYIMGDWNAKVGNQEVKGIAGKFGLGRRNGRGDRLIEFCVENDLFIVNTVQCLVN